MHRAALRIGLTGGIGSGKSTVARTLVACGAALVDADAISRAVTAAGGTAVKEIAAQFGDRFVTSDGAMDRELMRQLAFTDTSARRRLEAIVHPLVSQETLRQYGQCRQRRQRLCGV
jgi:dephospho-CoA kinase